MTGEALESILTPINGHGMRVISDLNVLSFRVLRGELVGDDLTNRLEPIENILAHSSRSGLKESVPVPSLLIDVGELHLCLGEREEAAKYLAMTRETLKSLPAIYASNPAAILCQLALLQAKLGSEVDALKEAFNLLSGLPNRFPPVNEGYRSVAMTAADCLHLGTRDESIQALIEKSIERISSKEERQDTLAHVIRKLCMRNETEPADDSALIGTAEKMLSRVGDPMERTFTTAQLGLAEALRGNIERARKQFNACRGMVTSRSSERFKYACYTNLFRAYSQAGFASEADELGEKLRKDFDEIISGGRETTRMIKQEREFLGGKLPNELREMSEELVAMIDAYATAISSSFIMAGWFPTRASTASADRFLDEGRGMVESMPTGYSRFGQYLNLSQAYAARGRKDDSLKVFRAAMDELANADRKTVRAMFPDDIALTCARGYLYTNDGKFVDAFLEYAKLLGVRGRTLPDGCYQFCSKLASLARDKMWRLTFYINI